MTRYRWGFFGVLSVAFVAVAAPASGLTRFLESKVIGKSEDDIVAWFGRPGTVKTTGDARVLSWHWRIKYRAPERSWQAGGGSFRSWPAWHEGNCLIEVTFDAARIARAVDYSGSRQACQALLVRYG